MSESYRWRAHLADGRVIDEGEVPGWGYLPSGVTAVELLPSGGGIFQRRQPLRVDVPQGARAVYFRRRQIMARLNDGRTELAGTRHCIGFQGAGGEGYLWVDDSGRVKLTATQEG